MNFNQLPLIQRITIIHQGFWPGEKEPECSQKDIDKVEEYCKDNTDTCQDYNVESP